MRVLPLLEALVVAGFLAIATLALLDPPAPELPTLDAAALATGPAEERWVGVFIQGKHVGYAVSREADAAGGGRVHEERLVARIGAMGAVSDLVVAGTALADGQGRVRSFDFVVAAAGQRITGRGVVRGNDVHVEYSRGGEPGSLDVRAAEPPVIPQTLGALVRGRPLSTGQRFAVPMFHPLLLEVFEAEVLVQSPEILPNGDEAWWLRVRYAGVESRKLVDADGELIREEGQGGMSTVRMTREEAMAVDEGDPPDLVALSAVPLAGPAPAGARVTLRISGVEPSRFASEPPLQTVAGDVVTVSVPLLQELPRLPVVATPEEAGEELAPTPSIPSTHPDIVGKARAVVGDAPDRLEAARRLYTFVYEHVEKTPTIGVPNGLDTLRTGRGDCNEHTALYVSLARAAGIPARIAAGLVYSERLGHAFYYHAWPEVKLGGPAEWVPIDPTLGQFPADGSHLKVLNGDLDRQIEITALLGRVRLESLPTR